MAQSRIQKFKDYRNSLIKEDCPVSETPIIEEIKSENKFETTSTLPLDEVMKQITKEEEDAVVKKNQKNKLVIQIIIFSVIVALIIAGIVIFAIKVF